MATRGSWNEVWDAFDRRMKAKAANDGDGAGTEGGEEDMFSRAGVAAE